MLSHFSHVRLCKLVGHSPTASSVYGTLQARKLEWVAMPSSTDLPDPGIQPMSPIASALAGGFFTTSITWEAPCDPAIPPLYIYLEETITLTQKDICTLIFTAYEVAYIYAVSRSLASCHITYILTTELPLEQPTCVLWDGWNGWFSVVS